MPLYDKSNIGTTHLKKIKGGQEIMNICVVIIKRQRAIKLTKPIVKLRRLFLMTSFKKGKLFELFKSIFYTKKRE